MDQVQQHWRNGRNIVKIVKSFEESRLLTKEIRETIKNEIKEQKGRFSWLDTSILTGKGVIRASEGVIRIDQNFECCLIL